MLSKFLAWFKDNEMQLTWGFIGFFAACFVQDIGKQDYVNALIDLVLVVINYVYRPR
jgi:hypothetical protein